MAFTRLMLHYATPTGAFTIRRFLWTYTLTIDPTEPGTAPTRLRYRARKREVYALARELVRIDAEEGRIPLWIAEHVTAILADADSRS
jgi:hypothetical protein